MDKFIEIPVKPGGFMESQSGIQRRNPKIFARLVWKGERPQTVYVLVHPTSNFHSHYLIDPLVARGVAVCLVNTRYVANDSMLIMERAIQDLGAAMTHLRHEGFERIVLIGNSGGGSLAALYQQQSERLTIQTTPDGRSINLEAGELPAADALALVCAHPGRAEQLLMKIDPAILDERYPDLRRASLDMYDPANGPAYAEEWVHAYRHAQRARLDHITEWVLARLRQLEQGPMGEGADEAFIIHCTQADPRLLDLALDANDRTQGTIQGNAFLANLASNGLARFCTLRSFLSQWSPRYTRAHGPSCLADTSCPVLVVNHTADQTVFPSQIDAWVKAAGSRGKRYDLAHAPHYLDDKPDLLTELADLLVSWK
ncbi:MAG: alpha/beta hydrolase [Pigmentiphaga sp.]|nr:alpha/beta hydrolase [Pigmentiphaga sp.]